MRARQPTLHRNTLRTCVLMLACLLCLASLGVAGCDDLSGYSGTFAGDIVDGNFVRSCFPAKTRATLRFDPERAVASVGDGKDSELNRLTTTDGTFTKTLLEPITALPHDQLSELDFPGPHRLRNFILLARPERGPLAGRDATVVVSLLENGSIEVRIIGRTADTLESCPTEGEGPDAAAAKVSDAGPSAAVAASARPREYFGVFILK